MEELYSLSEYKLTRMLVVAFHALHVYFIYIKHAYFVTLIKYILELLRTLFYNDVYPTFGQGLRVSIWSPDHLNSGALWGRHDKTKGDPA